MRDPGSDVNWREEGERRPEPLPVDSRGSIDVRDVESMRPDRLKRLIDDAIRERFGKRREKVQAALLDGVHDKHVLVFPCGFGSDAVQLARAGARISLADPRRRAIRCASRLLWSEEQPILQLVQAKIGRPVLEWPKGVEPVSVVVASEAFERFRNPRDYLEAVRILLGNRGELRIVLAGPRGAARSVGELGAGLFTVEREIFAHGRAVLALQPVSGFRRSDRLARDAPGFAERPAMIPEKPDPYP